MMESNRVPMIDTVLRLLLIGLLGYWVFSFLLPFISVFIWGAILAISLNPLHRGLLPRFGDRRGLCASVMVLGLLSLLAVPAGLIASSAIDNAEAFGTAVRTGTLEIPAPPKALGKVPVVGPKIQTLWTAAAADFPAFSKAHEKSLKSVARRISGMAASAAGAMLNLMLALAVAGALLAYAHDSIGGVHRIARRIGGARGAEIATLAGATIMSVAKGVVGVAFLQAVLIGAGMFAMGVPYAGLITLVVLLLAILQLPLFIVVLPVIIYEFNVADTLPATLFAVWSVVAALSDNVLKPLLLGRGVEVPALVILAGAIGGMFTEGFIGLFEGAVVLAVAYTLLIDWLKQGEINRESHILPEQDAPSSK
jgi:predicted PurR-regulated permease PerM